MLNEGWIKLHRKVLLNPIVCKDAEHLAVWVYLLLQATHEDRQALFNGEKITIRPGQLLTTYQTIADELKITKLKVQRIISDMRNDTQIDTLTDRQKSLITLNNWELYQGAFDTPNDTPSDTRMIHEAEKEKTKEKKNQKEKTKENKELTRMKEDMYIPLPLNQLKKMFNQFWDAYPKKVGKEYAYKCFLKIKLTEPLMECILSAIEEQKQSKLWQDRQYIPNPSTWLNQARWEDEITEDDKKPTASYGDANSFFEAALKRTYEDEEDE